MHYITNTWRLCRHKLIITFICLPHPLTMWLFDSQHAFWLCLMSRRLIRRIYCLLISSSCGMEQGVNASRLDLSMFTRYRTDWKESVSPPVLNDTDNMNERFLETIYILCWFKFFSCTDKYLLPLKQASGYCRSIQDLNRSSVTTTAILCRHSHIVETL